MFPTWGGIASQVQAGQLRALGVTSAQRSKLAPDLPTLAEAGVPGYESTGMFGVFAPAKTPAAIIMRLNREISQMLEDPAVRERFFNAGAETVGGTPEQFAKAMRADVAKVEKVVKAAGIRDE
jgi:tripartite-type tricarboxylate transporter receptor subunit TctC